MIFLNFSPWCLCNLGRRFINGEVGCWGLAARGYVWSGRCYVAEGVSYVYDSLIYAVYDAWGSRDMDLHMPVDDCWCRLSQLMEGEGICLVG